MDYTITEVFLPYRCENEKPGHVHAGSLYHVAWYEDGQSHYFINCFAALNEWIKTIDRASLLNYI